MTVDVREIKKLIALAEEAGLAELEIAEGHGTGQKRIRIVRVSPAASTTPAAATPSATGKPAAAKPGQVFAAPLSGTFYRSPAPGEAPFVEAGQEVSVGDTLCIIESMKMMNKVGSDRAGTIAEALVENGRAIETGTPLFRIA